MNDRKVEPRLFVIDSSVAVKWLNSKDEKHIEKSDKILKDLQAGKIRLIAPELSKYEIGNALLNKNISIEAAKISLASFYRIPIEFISFDQYLAINTMDIAYESKITYYDASFIALAQKLKATLITDNPKHHKKYKAIKIVSLKNYK